MAEQLCPVCGCQIADDGYEKGRKTHCCEPCAESSSCECGCCQAASEK